MLNDIKVLSHAKCFQNKKVATKNTNQSFTFVQPDATLAAGLSSKNG